MKRIDINKDKLRDLYINKKMSPKECGYKLGCSNFTIYKKLRENSILIRTSSEAHKGQHSSPETEFKKGCISWMKGKKHKEESIRKMSENQKGNEGYWQGKHRSEETKQAISKANKGKTNALGTKHSEEVKHKSSELRRGKHYSPSSEFKKGQFSGKKHHNWQDGKSFEKYTIQFNKELKELIRQRDSYQCQLCGMSECENIRKLHIHHINYDKKNCLPNNLISLCTSCHVKTNYNKKDWIEYFIGGN